MAPMAGRTSMDYMQGDPSAYMVSLFFGHLQPPQTSLVVSTHPWDCGRYGSVWVCSFVEMLE